LNKETEFLIALIPVTIQFLILFAFYFAVLRRLFIPPTPSNVLVLAIVLIGIPGFPLVFIWGWLRHKRLRMTQLMASWTLAIVVFVLSMAVLAEIEKMAPLWVTISLPVISMLILAAIAFYTLIPFLRADECMRSLMRESSPQRIAALASLRAQAIPNIQLMLEDDYSEYRLDGVECLAIMGPVGVPLLHEIAKGRDSQLATYAKAALEGIEL